MAQDKKNFPKEIPVLFLLVLAASFYPSQTFPQDTASSFPKIRSYTDKREVSIGDRLRYSTTVSAGPGADVEFPQIKDRIANFEIKDSGIISKTAFGKRHITKWYIFNIYDTGEQVIPGLTIRYRSNKESLWEEISSNNVTISVNSIFKKAKITDDIKEIEPPVSFAWAYKFHIISGLIILIVLTCGLSFYLERRRRILERIRLGPPPDVVAYNRLNNILLSIYDKGGMHKEHFIAIADLTREYMEKRLKLKTKGMTTLEFINKVKGLKDFPGTYEQPLADILRISDMAKFANYNPAKEEFDSELKIVKRLIGDIKPEEEA